MKKMKFVGEWEARNWLTLHEWRERGITVYSEDDIKEELLAIVHINTRYCFHDWLEDVIKQVKRNNGRVKCFCKVDGVLYFTDMGYEKIIKYLKKTEIIRPERAS